MLAAPTTAATALRPDLTSVLVANFAAYQALADDYRATSALRLMHADRWLDRVLAQPHPNGSALDIGCADGSHAWLLAKHGYDVTAIDFSPRMIELVRSLQNRFRDHRDRRPPSSRASFSTGPFRDATGTVVPLGRQFDVIVANAFVHLFPRPTDAAVMRKTLRLVAPEV